MFLQNYWSLMSSWSQRVAHHHSDSLRQHITCHNIYVSAKIAWPWRSMCTLSMSSGIPPSPSSASPEAMQSPQQSPELTSGKSRRKILVNHLLGGRPQHWGFSSKTFFYSLVSHVRNTPIHTLAFLQADRLRHTLSELKKVKTLASIMSYQHTAMVWTYKNRWPGHKSLTYL